MFVMNDIKFDEIGDKSVIIFLKFVLSTQKYYN